jgi:hypothetical protein
MFSNNIILFIFFIFTIKDIFSQTKSYYNDNYYDDSSSYQASTTIIIIAVIIYLIIMIGGIILCIYCCCYRNRNRQTTPIYNQPSNYPNYLSGQVYVIPANNRIISQPMIPIQYPYNIPNTQTNGNQDLRLYQNGNYNPENQILNLNHSELELKVNYLFQNNMKPEIYSERFGKDEKECTICLNKFILNKSKIVLTPCHHFFHFYCLKKYLLDGKGKKCPNCNSDFFETFNSIQLIPSKIKIIPLDEKDNPNNEQ